MHPSLLDTANVPRSCAAMSAWRLSACTEPKMTSISSKLRPFVSGMRLHKSIVRDDSRNTEREWGGLQREDGHAADVDRREHEEELVAQVGLERRRHLRHDEV